MSNLIKRMLEMFGNLWGPEPEPTTFYTPNIWPFVMWGLLIMAAVFLLAAISYRAWRYHKTTQEDMDSLPVKGELASSLRHLLQQQAQSLANRLTSLLRRPDRLWAAARIRRVYSLLMHLSAALGHPRPTACTPLEFLPTLEKTFPSLRVELGIITDAYLRVRYGQLPESYREVQVVENAWRQVQSAGRAQLVRNRREM